MLKFSRRETITAAAAPLWIADDVGGAVRAIKDRRFVRIPMMVTGFRFIVPGLERVEVEGGHFVFYTKPQSCLARLRAHLVPFCQL